MRPEAARLGASRPEAARLPDRPCATGKKPIYLSAAAQAVLADLPRLEGRHMKRTSQDSEPILPVLRVVTGKPRRFFWQIFKGTAGRPIIRPEELCSWIREACGDAQLPSDEQCELLADELTEISCMGLGPVIEPTLGLAEKHGRLFLRHIPAAIKKMEAIPNSERAQPGLEAMQAAEREVRRLLELFDYPIKQPSWHDQARFFAVLVRETLQTTGKSYRDVNEASPLCSIVTQVLGAIGHHKEQSAVSEALRGRRGTGRKRNKNRP